MAEKSEIRSSPSAEILIKKVPGIKMSMKDLNLSPTAITDVRGKMKKFWEQYDPTPKSMMLCSAANDEASELAAEDRLQVLKTCPALKGKRVLELGAGIG